jgi:hypothetical protein
MHDLRYILGYGFVLYILNINFNISDLIIIIMDHHHPLLAF